MKRPAPCFSRAITILSILALLLLSMCKRPDDSVAKTGKVEADFIGYRVEYLEKRAGDIPTNLLPDRMEAYYTRNYILTRIEGYFGQFSLVQVAHLKRRSVITMLNFFGTKVYYIGERNEIPVGIRPLEDPEVDFTDEQKTIAGLESHKALINLPGESYEIYYTREIDVKSPNITTPYSFIDHVLSDFRVQLSVLKMRLIIDEHKKTELDYSFFSVPDDYERISRGTMENIINNLFTKE